MSMKREIKIGLTGLVMLILGIVLASNWFISKDKSKDEFIAGGPCAYDKFRGECKITSILKTERSKQQVRTIGGPGYEGFEIKFRFIPTKPLNVENVKWIQDVQEDILNREYLLLLTNSWYPGPKYLEKYNIKENAVLGCELNLITKGTCSPIVFKFDNIDTSDYFEMKK